MKTKSILAMIKNRANREEVYSKADYWDSKAEELQGDAVSMWPNNILNKHYHEEQMHLVNNKLGEFNAKKILDVGCGTGRLSRYLSRRGAYVTGIDFSEKAINIAKNIEFDKPITYKVQSVFDMNDEEYFDIIFSWGCVVIAAKNRDELKNILDKLRKSLKPDGRVLMLEPIHQGFVHRVLDMDINEFCDVMELSGFKIESVTDMHFWPIRYLIAFLPFPAFITTPCYLFGQWLMKLPMFKNMGDYKGVYAIAVKN